MDSASKWLKTLSRTGLVRAVVIDGKRVCEEASKLHGYQGEEKKAFSEALLSSLVLASTSKNNEHINVQILSESGWVKQAIVDAHTDGRIRGYLIPRTEAKNDYSHIVPTEERGPWGHGLFCVLRSKEGQVDQQPYIGKVPLLTGHLAKDLTYYWLQSEQVRSSCGIFVDLDEKTQEITLAGAFLIQAMPGATEQEISMIEKQIQSTELFCSELSKSFESTKYWLSSVFENEPFQIIEERELFLSCNCSMDRVSHAVSLLGKVELTDMIQKKEPAEVTCDFCRKHYRIDVDQLKKMV